MKKEYDLSKLTEADSPLKEKPFEQRGIPEQISLVFKEDVSQIPFDQVIDLYNSVNWSAHTQNPTDLETALKNSTYVICALENNRLIGLARSVSDDISMHYLQDILIHPDFQGKGVGRELIKMIKE